VLALAAIAATACKKGGDTDTTQSDTTAVPGTDTTQTTVNTVVPTTDSVVTTTTTTTDTVQGQAHDTTQHDTAKKM
ncbi:MAG: hypothetical protein ACJ8J0_01235, partial [Longimicrobiaceae bacterium]